MDEWSKPLIGVIVGIGNSNANSFWEGTLPDGVKPTVTATLEERAVYIKAKYQEKRFVLVARS